MLKLLFKTTAYYVIWQKFKKQIMMVIISIILISLIGLIYEDLFEVLKVTNRDSVGALLFFKWFFISLIIAFNVYVLRKTKIDSKELETKDIEGKENKKIYTQNEKKILEKEELLTTTDLILKKYGHKK